MRSLLFILPLSLLLIVSCKQKGDPGILVSDDGQRTGAAAEDSLLPAVNEFQVLATLYTQASAEYRAQCLQSYRMAKEALLMADLKEKPRAITEKKAVVLDIDETVLDNSPYQALCITQGISYPECWDEWCGQANAGAVPGALDFIEFARKMDVEVFFITNRKEHLREVTVRNLESLGLGTIDEDHLLMRTAGNSKEERRMKVREDYRILLLIGDNLADFNSYFDGKDSKERSALVDSMQTYFGERYILLPNTMYGDWLSAIYGYSYDLGEGEREAAWLRSLRPGVCE